jgi:hypothetical protein
LAGVFLAGALAAGTTAAVQLVGGPAEAAAAEPNPAAARTVSMTLSEEGGETSGPWQATVTAGAASLWLWLGAAVGLVGVLLLFSVGRKPAVPAALKETAVHEAAIRFEPVRHSSALLWIGLLLVVLVLLLVSAFLFTGTSVNGQPGPASTPANNGRAADGSTPPSLLPVPADRAH